MRPFPQVLLTVLVLNACAAGDTSGPESDHTAVTMSATSHAAAIHGASPRAAGNGQILFQGERKTFAFTAVQNRAHGVTGQFQTFGLFSDLPLHGVITCATVVGNVAWLGGVITHFAFPEAEGRHAAWVVVDNGEGAAAPADRISFGFILPAFGAATAQEFCDELPDLPLNEVVAGNIQVRP